MNAAIDVYWDAPPSIEAAYESASGIDANTAVLLAQGRVGLVPRDIAKDIDGQRVLFLVDQANPSPRQHAWQSHLTNPAASGDVDALTETAQSVFESLAKYGPSGVSLTNLSATAVHGEHLATVLRATFKWRSQIPGWNESLAIAADALRHAGINPTDALFGLSK